MTKAIRSRLRARPYEDAPLVDAQAPFDAAREYAARDWAVLPVHSPAESPTGCDCGRGKCTSPAKHPRTARGVKDATKDIATLREWWERWPRANVGIATGAASGIVVLDVDPDKGGGHSLAELKQHHGAPPQTPTVLTGGGGRHLYFTAPSVPIRNKVGLAPGLDLRGDGGYVVAPPSVHASGNRYRWAPGLSPDEMQLAPMPDWLFKIATEDRRKNGTAPGARDTVREGARNDYLTSVGGFLRARGLNQQGVEAALVALNSAVCSPPLSEEEVRGVAASVSRYPPGRASDDLPGNDVTPTGRGALSHDYPFHTARELAARTPPRVPWIANPYVAKGTITELSGKLKSSGKTTFLMHLVAAVLNGGDFLGHPTVKTKVVYLTEERETTLRQALERAGLQDREDLLIRFYSEKPAGTAWKVMAEDSVREALNRGAGLLIVDTLPQFSELRGDAENNVGDALEAIRPLQEAAAQGLAVIVVRHDRKSGGEVGDSARGSTAFGGAVDIVISLRRMGGHGMERRREIHALSRFDETPERLVIGLLDGEYVALGDAAEVALADAARLVESTLAESKDEAMTESELLEDLGDRVRRTTARKALTHLMEARRVRRKPGGGKTGRAYVYWRPSK